MRLLRMMRNITQAQLAKELGIGANSVNRYENDARIPKEKTMKKIADYYGVHIDDIQIIAGQRDGFACHQKFTVTLVE
nr:helix-turn-helix transcriptional regulator [Bacillus mesophilus]